MKRDTASGNPTDSSSGNGTYTELFSHKVEYAIMTGKIVLDNMLYCYDMYFVYLFYAKCLWVVGGD